MIFDEPLKSILEDYKKAHPTAEDPTDHLHALGEKELERILTEAKGREVVFFILDADKLADDPPINFRYG
jgi:hypothetical protein|tara:strand:- start:375 stop:584 length:210 start_codon:yes stop_codon:yes gene_type:complete